MERRPVDRVGGAPGRGDRGEDPGRAPPDALRGRRRGTAVVVALAGDRHSLPTAMAAAALRDDNWHVHHLGADVPGADLMRFIDDQAVDLVVLTVTTPDFRPAVEGVVAQLEGAGRRVLVGTTGARLDELQRSARAH